jgi:hypothetical protein
MPLRQYWVAVPSQHKGRGKTSKIHLYMNMITSGGISVKITETFRGKSGVEFTRAITPTGQPIVGPAKLFKRILRSAIATVDPLQLEEDRQARARKKASFV